VKLKPRYNQGRNGPPIQDILSFNFGKKKLKITKKKKVEFNGYIG